MCDSILRVKTSENERIFIFNKQSLISLAGFTQFTHIASCPSQDWAGHGAELITYHIRSSQIAALAGQHGILLITRLCSYMLYVHQLCGVWSKEVYMYYMISYRAIIVIAKHMTQLYMLTWTKITHESKICTWRRLTRSLANTTSKFWYKVCKSRSPWDLQNAIMLQ